jgi:hypothetical protein
MSRRMGELLQQNPDLTLRELKAELATALSIQTLGPHDVHRLAAALSCI